MLAHISVLKLNFSGMYHTQRNSHVPQFKGFLPLSLNFNEYQVNKIRNIFSHFNKVSSVKSSNPLFAKGIKKGGFL